jgi:hypothetical protein
LSIILTTTKVLSILSSTTIILSISLTTSIIKSWCIIEFAWSEIDTGATVSIVSNDIYQKIPDVARPTLTSTNQEALTVSGDKLKILDHLLLLLLSFHSEQA